MYNFRLGLIKKFILFGYEVCVIAPEDDYTEKIKAEGIRFVPVKKLNRSGINPIEDLILCIEYVKIYKILKPSFIFHYTVKPNIYGTLAAKYCKIKSISITTGLGNAFSNNGALFYFAKYLYKLSSIYAAEVWFLNSSDRAIFFKNKIITERNSFILPGEGVNTSLFKPTQPYPENEVTTFLLVSRMLYDKGIYIFTEASRILIKKGYAVSSILLGQLDLDNPEAISIETIEKWQQEGIITYLGSTTDVKPYIEKANVVVLPSYYKEGIPKVLLEAASMQKPIIASRIPGCIEVVDDGVNGYLCTPRDVEDLSEKMEKFIHLSQVEKIAMGKAGRKKIMQNFDEDIIINIYLDKIKQHSISK
jgi:glycosyltransferase involved in cell wall biosynthesis